MRPTEPMSQAMRSSLAPLAAKLEERLELATAGDPRAVHASRTTLRRVREGVRMLGLSGGADAETERLGRRLKRIERALGSVRDDDVLLEDVQKRAHEAPAEGRCALGELAARVGRRRAKHARRAARELKRRRTRRTVAELNRFVADASGARRSDGRRTLVRHHAFDQIWRAYEEILAYETERPASVTVMHKVRGACRRLRFTLELFRDALAPPVDEVIARLRDAQDRLGTLHDDAVAIELVEEWIRRGKLTAAPAIDAYLKDRRARLDQLVAGFDEQWRALDNPAFQESLFRTLSGTRVDPASDARARAIRVVPAA